MRQKQKQKQKSLLWWSNAQPGKMLSVHNIEQLKLWGGFRKEFYGGREAVSVAGSVRDIAQHFFF